MTGTHAGPTFPGLPARLTLSQESSLSLSINPSSSCPLFPPPVLYPPPPPSAEVISYSEWRDLYYVQTAKGAYIKNTVENYPESVTVSEVRGRKDDEGVEERK